ncbi:MAG TPA: DNA-processing protein DprA [Solirubrobacteraceae bacterium]|nr:DNA-processing protein DprA [Solirubrobacteraceae bacterium]
MSACPTCLRRSWLLGALNGRLEYRGREPGRLVSLLELSDGDLIRAAAGNEEREGLLMRYEQLAISADGPSAGDVWICNSDPPMRTPSGIARICRHDPRYPHTLARGAGAPRALHVAGGVDRLRKLLAEPVVAIVGTRRASDYGMEVAHGLARGLAASGITVVSGLAEGIPAAAHAGALHAGRPTVTVMPGGVDVCYPAIWRDLHRELLRVGCALAELPCGCAPRSWCHTARARIVVGLAQMVIVVEARESPAELLHARLAAASGVLVAAVPGRVSAPAARGPHVLLREGAHLVRDPQDALDALYGVGVRHAPAGPHAELDPRLREVLEQVSSGRDTVAKLTDPGADESVSATDTLVALAQLELSGALVRGDGGRYVVRR